MNDYKHLLDHDVSGTIDQEESRVFIVITGLLVAFWTAVIFYVLLSMR